MKNHIRRITVIALALVLCVLSITYSAMATGVTTVADMPGKPQ